MLTITRLGDCHTIAANIWHNTLLKLMIKLQVDYLAMINVLNLVKQIVTHARREACNKRAYCRSVQEIN